MYSFPYNFSRLSLSCGRSRWPLVLRCGSVGARLLRLRVRIPQGYGYLSHVSVVCCQVEVFASGWLLDLKNTTECSVSKNRKRTPWPGIRSKDHKKRSISFNPVLLLNISGVLDILQFSSYCLRCSTFVLRKCPNILSILQIISAIPKPRVIMVTCCTFKVRIHQPCHPPNNIQPQEHLWLLNPSAYSQLPSVMHVDAVSTTLNLMALGVTVIGSTIKLDYLIA